ncbi:hypothetical protein HO173_004962 [Letharia columbiana]|uniref:Uncharacterized protein n=1 Tax=Letharia columbiana TaxID=112416 RepID=A0A8H6FXN8_9LECA|nr:uncharacterized protein HO173_004962 [Letharia columbiana]KAF6236671.1 hypothetical protein HO173_004962 [Letharia columbiana]
MADTIEKEAYDEAKSALQCYLLSQPLQSLSSRYYFLSNVFDLQPFELHLSTIQATDNAYESFFTRYAYLCKLAANKDREIERVTHWHLVEIIALLKDHGSTREEIAAMITQDPVIAHSGSLARTLVDLAAGLWLMLLISKYPGDISYDEPIIWRDNEKLGEERHELNEGFINKNFSCRYNSTDLVKLPQAFTAAHLEQIGGIKVEWTSNLADHLLLKDDDTKLMLFHQVSILQLHKKSPTTLLPKVLVDETIRSISLLIPPVLGEPNPWFQQQRKKWLIDAQSGVCHRLNSSERQIEKFVYWRERLVLLKRTFDDAEPRNISQLWWDDRKKTQWFTFWVAVLVFIMTVFFGVVQSVAGIVQAWASVQSLKAQKAQS